jgi:hypothetical protein
MSRMRYVFTLVGKDINSKQGTRELPDDKAAVGVGVAVLHALRVSLPELGEKRCFLVVTNGSGTQIARMSFDEDVTAASDQTDTENSGAD